MNWFGAFVGDGNAGAQFPAGVLKGNLNMHWAIEIRQLRRH